ncbi:MAG: hypothetical protein AAF478_08930 [Pseudomonadota bacterium]
MPKIPDNEVELTKEIDAAHPALTGRQDLYDRAEGLLEHRQSKSSVTNLVYFLLYKLESK